MAADQLIPGFLKDAEKLRGKEGKEVERMFQHVNLAQRYEVQHDVRIQHVKGAQRYEVQHVNVAQRYQHGVRIQDGALVVDAARLYNRNIMARANVRVQPDSQKDIDSLKRKGKKLEAELHALEKENDKVIKARLGIKARIGEVRKELDELKMVIKHREEKERVNNFRKLEQKREELLVAYAQALRRGDFRRMFDLKNCTIPDVETKIAKMKVVQTRTNCRGGNLGIRM